MAVVEVYIRDLGVLGVEIAGVVDVGRGGGAGDGRGGVGDERSR